MWPRFPALRSGRRATAQSILADRPSRHLGRLIDKPSDDRALSLQGWITTLGGNAAGVAIISVWPSLRALDQPENGDEDDRADDCGDDRSDRSANGYAARPGSERQWGTVREDYSETGDAWNYFTHDQARSRAYHWGEDGLAGFSDDRQQLCFALALWNGRDPIIKERLFGLTNSEANHGEDVKEYYFYLDSTPTHSYMKWLYKYPQGAYPYGNLIETNKRLSRADMEYELLDTGIFNGDRYFDVFVEYAKQTPEDILIQISVCNRGPEPAALHVLPTLWFRNIWTWWPGTPKPALQQATGRPGARAVAASHPLVGERYLYCEGDVPLLFTENEPNNARLFGTPNASPYVKDGINNYVVHGQHEAVNPEHTGTKAAAHY